MASLNTPAPTDPDSTAGNYGGAARMAGPAEDSGNAVQPDMGGGGDSSAGGTGGAQQALSNATAVIRKCEESITALSKQFPQASKEIRQAISAVRSVLQKIVSNPGGPEPTAPRSGM